MKKNSLFKVLPLLAVALVGVAIATSCKKESTTQNNTIDKSIVNVKWQLSKFIDCENNTETMPEYNSDTIYWLRFDLNGNFVGHTFSNSIYGKYLMDISNKNFKFSELFGTELNELYDGQKYSEALNIVCKYGLNGNQLYLYYNSEKEVLVFKKSSEL